MNPQITRLAVAAIVLLAALIVGTTYWQTWANAGLADRQDNDIRLVAQFSIKRGKIYAADGRTLLAQDGFSKLLAAGLTFGFALQTFIIVGGILRLIPLTGITLPFVSYGGSSVVANFLLLAGLLLVSNRANREVLR